MGKLSGIASLGFGKGNSYLRIQWEESNYGFIFRAGAWRAEVIQTAHGRGDDDWHWEYMLHTDRGHALGRMAEGERRTRHDRTVGTPDTPTNIVLSRASQLLVGDAMMALDYLAEDRDSYDQD